MSDYLERLTKISDLENLQNKHTVGIPASKENNAFFSIISHNIKNPFTTLIGFTDLLYEDYELLDDVERKFYLSEIIKSAQFTNKYLERFFEWIYYKNGKVKINIERLELNELINYSINLIFKKFNTQNIASDLGSQIFVKGDSESIIKIIYYVLENAVLHSGSENEIIIKSQIDFFNQNVIVTIKDFGKGMSEDQIAKLFKINEDITLNSCSDTKGTGLGLILSDLLVKINNGKISVSSKLNEGVEVKIELPIS